MQVKCGMCIVVLRADEQTPSTTAAADHKCSSDEFTCGDGTCIPLSQRCDWSEYHCPDGTDEFDCRTLSLVQFFLTSSTSVSVYLVYN